MNPVVLVLQQFVLSMEGLLHGICLNCMLTPKHPKQPFWLRVAYFYGSFLVIMSFSWISGMRVPSYINLVMVCTVFQILMKFVFQEKWHVRLLAYLTLYVCLAAADILISCLYVLVLQRNSLDYMAEDVLMQVCGGMLIAAMLDWLACSLWLQRRSTRFSSSLMAGACLAVTFLHTVYFAFGIFGTQNGFNPAILGASLLSFAGTGSAIAFCFYFQQKQGKQNQLEWENLSRIRSSQEAFFRTLEEQERKTSFIRHDHLNVLGTVSQLLAQEQVQPALQLLDDYQNRMQETPPAS